MNYSFLALKCSPPSIHPRGSIYSPSIGNKGQFRVFLSIWKAKSQVIWDLLRKTPFFLFLCTFLDVCRLTWSNLRVQEGFSLKVTYSNKQVFFREFLGSSKYNSSKGGPKNLQRDMEGHKNVIYQVR